MNFYKVEAVSFSYPNKQLLLRNVNFDIGNKEWIGLSGSNGAGKSTLIKLLMGILKPQTGEILINDVPIQRLSLSQIGTKVGYVFQEPSRQFFTPSVREELGFRIRNVDESKKEDLINKWLDYFDIREVEHSFPLHLSRGQMQRLAMACAMAMGTDFFIFDEPTVGLDSLRLKNLEDCLCRLKTEGKGCLVVSHDVSFLKRHTDRIMRLNKRGEIQYGDA